MRSVLLTNLSGQGPDLAWGGLELLYAMDRKYEGSTNPYQRLPSLTSCCLLTRLSRCRMEVRICSASDVYNQTTDIMCNTNTYM